MFLLSYFAILMQSLTIVLSPDGKDWNPSPAIKQEAHEYPSG
jgi:hypothetical protein